MSDSLETRLNRFKHASWWAWLHHLYVLLALVGYGATVIITDNQSNRELVLLAILGLYLLVTFIVLIASTYMYNRKARFAEAMRLIHGAVHESRNAYHYLDWCRDAERDQMRFDDVRFKTHLQKCLTAASTAFSITTGTSCRMSIKVIGQTEEENCEPYVKTLCRDVISESSCAEKDKNEKQRHKINDNTDFKRIFKHLEPFYFNGDLEETAKNYENTSFPRNCTHNDNVKWELEYVSTIVWPIRYLYDAGEDAHGNSNDLLDDQDLYGYLTVDSDARNSFSRRYDVQMGAILADALFPIFDTYHYIKQKNKTSANEQEVNSNANQ